MYSHALLSNILTTILRPNFEKPLRTAKDLAENGLRLFDIPGFGYLQELLDASPDPYVQVCTCLLNQIDVFQKCQKVRPIFFNSGQLTGSGDMCPQINSIYFFVLLPKEWVKKS